MPGRSSNAQPIAGHLVFSEGSLAFRTLINIAERRPALDASSCRSILGMLETASLLDTTLRATLWRRHLNESSFAVLVALFAVEPDPMPAAALAEHTGLGHADLASTLIALQSANLVEQSGSHAQPMAQYALTSTGTRVADQAIGDVLLAATAIGRGIAPQLQLELLSAQPPLRSSILAVNQRRPDSPLRKV